ncbi:MAG: hypothetical protein ACI97N_001465 [Cognaticolwellia sp.]|jgi:hypothetical protein
MKNQIKKNLHYQYKKVIRDDTTQTRIEVMKKINT